MMQWPRHFAKSAGLVLTAIAIGVFTYVFLNVLSQSDLRSLVTRHWTVILIAILIYCFAYVPMTIAWIQLAEASGAQASRLALARVLLVSQIGKYIPGSIAQFLGRAYFARAYGVPLASTGLAIALELAGILAASGILAAAVMALELVGLQSAKAESLMWLLGAAGAATLFGSALVLRNRGREAIIFLNPLLWAICLYVAVLALLALANSIIIAEIEDSWSLSMATKVAGAFLVSWLIGFATPGSPAGLGVRELTFFALLSSSIPQETLLLTATGFRLVTIVGDGIAWLAGVCLPVRKGDPTSPEPIPI